MKSKWKPAEEEQKNEHVFLQEQYEDRGLSDRQDLPPFVKTWKQFYLLLIGWLIVLITAFYIFTKYTQ